MFPQLVPLKILNALIKQFLWKMPRRIDKLTTHKFIILIKLFQLPKIKAIFDCIWINLQS